jgi:hypothetical protein
MSRIGRIALAVGLTTFGICLAASQLVDAVAGSTYLGRFICVANWRPIEIFLYDWWPLWRRRNLCRRLAAAAIVKADDDRQ